MNRHTYVEWKHWKSDSFGTFTPGDDAYFVAELRRCGVKSLKNLHLLELGFGNGAFAGWVNRLGAHYVGFELNPELVARGREKGLEVYASDVPLTEIVACNSQDLVVAFDVFEHCQKSELQRLLLQIQGVLKRPGCLIARVPSGDSPFGRAMQHGDVTHRVTLGSSAVRQLALEAGLDTREIREPAYPLRGSGARAFLRRSCVWLTRRLAYPMIGRLFMGDTDAILTPSMLIVLDKSDSTPCGVANYL